MRIVHKRIPKNARMCTCFIANKAIKAMEKIIMVKYALKIDTITLRKLSEY